MKDYYRSGFLSRRLMGIGIFALVLCAALFLCRLRFDQLGSQHTRSDVASMAAEFSQSPGITHNAQKPMIANVAPSQGASVSEAYGKLPLTFEVNEGQSDPRVRFLTAVVVIAYL